ncbi:hypothetical protein HMN09_01098200 [Mycena chlorophos]|uniref:Uncharacterized protein n=1 Tax=Mycena chlorophos TaxID=658473 RepID=A0A8H6SB30_MYCCL|nr:hypothetical protein HMN09_01098200 [Mycena chlorophos]
MPALGRRPPRPSSTPRFAFRVAYGRRRDWTGLGTSGSENDDASLGETGNEYAAGATTRGRLSMPKEQTTKQRGRASTPSFLDQDDEDKTTAASPSLSVVSILGLDADLAPTVPELMLALTSIPHPRRPWD